MPSFGTENRQKIYDCVAANPGVKFNALERLTGVKEGTLKYHLLILKMKRRIVSFGSGRSVRYFENNGRYSELEKKVFLHLQNPTTRRILEILASSPEVSRKDIAETVGIAGPSISWHTKRLSGDGIITTCKNGRAVRYTLCPAGANIFKRYREQDPGVCVREHCDRRGDGEVRSRSVSENLIDVCFFRHMSNFLTHWMMALWSPAFVQQGAARTR